jgi:fructoselysine-6-P-deglycase FrlB-like protein
VSQLRCVLWPMALDNTLMTAGGLVPAGRPCQTPLMAQGSGADLGDVPARPSRHVSAEIADQPSAWARAAKVGVTERVVHALPERGQRVAIIGCGTSFYMAQSFADLRERSGHGETDAFPASEFPARRSYDALVALTRSGMTTEVLRLLETLRKRTGTHTVAITADPDTPVVELADHRVVLDFADEKSIVQTRFATTSLALWRAWLGEDLTAVIGQGRSALIDPLPPPTLESAQFTFLGSGMSVGIANEAALKLREASQSWTESYPAMEFRHGPISVVGRASTVWVFGAPPRGLLEDLQVTGAHVESSGLDPMADLIRAQRLAVALAEAKGLNPDEPRHLARSVLLS